MRTLALMTALTAALLFTAPATLPAETTPIDASFRVAGALGNMAHRDTKAGMTFEVALRNLSYDGQVTRAVIEQTEADRAILWLAVRNMTLTVNRIDLRGQIGQAACGPMQVVVAHRREQWIGFELERLEQDGEPKLSVRGARFELSNDNWHIGTPAWVRTQGAFLTQKMVVDGLRRGLAQHRDILEQRLIQAAPTLLAHLCQSATDPDGPKRKIVEAVRGRLLPETITASAIAPSSAAPTNAVPSTAAAMPPTTANLAPAQPATRRPRPRPLDPATVSR